jgi:hypothetical protein
MHVAVDAPREDELFHRANALTRFIFVDLTGNQNDFSVFDRNIAVIFSSWVHQSPTLDNQIIHAEIS